MARKTPGRHGGGAQGGDRVYNAFARGPALMFAAFAVGFACVPARPEVAAAP